MSNRSPLASLLRSTTSTLITVVGGWLLYSRYAIDHNQPLPPAIDAERERLEGDKTGFLNIYVDKRSDQAEKLPPLVLIHSINAAGSAYEFGPIFQAYRGKRDVYALDLPGFGFSERADRVYSPELYKDAILALLDRIGEAADVIALSLSGEFAARAALERPQAFRSLALISPSGFTSREGKRASQSASDNGSSDTLYRVFSVPLWAQAFYDLIATPQSIRFFLKQSFEGAVDPGLENYGYLTSHQPGARFAPLYFVSGKLFSPDIREAVYAKLSLPVLVLYDRDAFVRFDTLPDFIDAHEQWQSVRIAPTKGLPQFEKLAEVTRALDEFWARLTSPRCSAKLRFALPNEVGRSPSPLHGEGVGG